MRVMKKNLLVCFVLLALAGLLPRLQAQPEQKGFSIQGVGLGWSDERVEALAGPEQPDSECPESGAHHHRYHDGLRVVFDELSFRAETVAGDRLELDGNVLLQAGDPEAAVTEPFLREIPLQNGARLVARPVSEGRFDEHPQFGWKPMLTKGLDRVFRVSYRYESKDGSMTDAYDFDLSIYARGGLIHWFTLHWLGH